MKPKHTLCTVKHMSCREKNKTNKLYFSVEKTTPWICHFATRKEQQNRKQMNHSAALIKHYYFTVWAQILECLIFIK